MDAMPKLLRFMEYNSLLRAIDYITALAFYDKRVFGDYKDLAERIQQLWEIADVSNRADAAKVYHAFIGIVFHPATLERMNEDDELRVTITDVRIHMSIDTKRTDQRIDCYFFVTECGRKTLHPSKDGKETS